MTTITIDRAVLERALEAINRALSDNTPYLGACEESACSLRAALAAQPAGRSPFLKERAQLEQEWAVLQGMLRDQKKGPAWHDAPTGLGIWICDEGDICYEWTAHNIEILDKFEPGEGFRWFGPIPEDTK